jgi:uncharacterized protein YabN with tetrapyrrole methylase and pyrophosphatase domain
MTSRDDKDERRAYGEKLKSRPEFESVLALIDALLGEGGCPWDRSRKLTDCPHYLRSELEEVVKAIEAGDDAGIEEELGDLLFMVALTARVAENEGRMTIEGLFRRILEKMVHRHPHVFGGDMDADTPDQVLANWQELKRREKAERDG